MPNCTSARSLLYAFTASLALFASGVAQAAPPETQLTLVKPSAPITALPALPGSVRRLYIKSGGSATSRFTWTVSGTTGKAGATITPSPTGNFADITLSGPGGRCPWSGSGTPKTIRPEATVTITVASAANPGLSDSQTLYVCGTQPLQVVTVPFYEVLYAKQWAWVQSWIWGSTDLSVTWKLTAQPKGGDGLLQDADRRDAAFQASVPGRYTLTATSVADPSKTSAITFFVTGNPLPYPVTPNTTEPVDPTPDPAAKGQVLEVGPSQPVKHLTDITPAQFRPGLTVRLHNEDTTSQHPTEYHEAIAFTANGAPTAPIRIVGVPDPHGNLPVLDGANAVMRPDLPAGAAQYLFGGGAGAGIMIYGAAYNGFPTHVNGGFVVVEGIRMTNFYSDPTHTNAYTDPSSHRVVPWGGSAAGLRIQNGDDIVLRGCDLDGNGNNVFTEFNAGQKGWDAQSLRFALLGNRIANGGAVAGYGSHNAYMQTWFALIQGNTFASYKTGAFGSHYKDRGIATVVRDNFFSPGAARILDFIEPQDSAGYIDPNIYALYPPAGEEPLFTASFLAAAQEVYHHSAYVYGNIFAAPSSGGNMHFSQDQGGATGFLSRTGELAFYNNTYRGFATQQGGDYRSVLFDLNPTKPSEWPTIRIVNNLFANLTGKHPPFFFWSVQPEPTFLFGKNQMPLNWGTDNKGVIDNSAGAADGSGWMDKPSEDTYVGADLRSNVHGDKGLVTSATAPFDLATFRPNGAAQPGEPLPPELAPMPVRFNFEKGVLSPRKTPVTATAGGTLGALD